MNANEREFKSANGISIARRSLLATDAATPSPSLPSKRASPTFDYEKACHARGFARVAGVDEAGRGPLAGPVVASAVVLPDGFESPHFAQLHDSKLLSEATREALFEEICARAAWGVGQASVEEIDAVNIRQAAWLAMQRAVEDLSARFDTPDFVLIDGLPFGDGPMPQNNIPYQAIVRGDGKSYNIAAASVVAKVWRDRLMIKADDAFPGYGFAKHKGYPTREHRNTLRRLGACALHRRTFGPVRDAIEERATQSALRHNT